LLNANLVCVETIEVTTKRVLSERGWLMETRARAKTTFALKSIIPFHATVSLNTKMELKYTDASLLVCPY
jgi:hypothetical protein